MTTNQPKGFNVRVYLFIINEKDEVLVSDEFHIQRYMTKLPGGGLELGESITACIHREMMEECEQDVDIIELIHVTDTFEIPIFHTDEQLIGIYYRVALAEPIRFRVSQKPFDFPGEKDPNQSFRWIPVSQLIDALTFKIDKEAARMMIQKKY